ncbi:MAG: C10 family peptidase, partial [Campylobacterota bacterium]|nr:C10 family peptidase [Campylobacterota bacterium]
MLLILVTSSLFSNEYEIIAEKFLQFKNQTKTIKSIEALKKDQTEVAYLFNLEGGGYILVPLSKSVSPVKSYSFHNNYDSLPPKVKKFIINELFNYISNRTLSKTINSNISDRWNFLETFTPTTNNRVLKSYIIDTNLLTTSWEQGYPYNKYFPKVNDESTLAGCVQVAFAQVMKYHAWPQKGKGIATHHAD